MPKAKLPGKEIRFALRLPMDVHERLRKEAERNRRSINAEIIILLEKGLPQQ